MKKNHIILGTVFLLLLAFLMYGRGGGISNNFDLSGGPEIQNRGFPQRKIIDLVSLYPKVFYREGNIKEKKVALTFDDGPDNNYNVKILDILKENNVPATFFLIGKRCEMYPDIVKRIVNEGHIIGNHTWSHPNAMKISNNKLKQEIIKAEKVIEKIAGYKPCYFRSPYGSLNPEKVEYIESLGYKIISWNVDSLDWKGLSGAEVKTNILENVKKGSIILQHSAGGVGEDLTGTVEALPEIIEVLKKEGFNFVTIEELLSIPYKKEK